MKLSQSANEILKNIANNLGVEYQDLFDLIKFESNFDPMAKNPITGAVGLLQFLDKAAIDLGYTKKEDIPYDLKTQEEQLQLAVYPYLKRYTPYENALDLYMAVFYPKYRKVDPNKKFPQHVIDANSGISTPLEYYNKVKQITNKTNILSFLAMGVLLLCLLNPTMTKKMFRM